MCTFNVLVDLIVYGLEFQSIGADSINATAHCNFY